MLTTLALQFLERIFETLNQHDIDISNHEIDHVCYRTSSEENYQETKKRFSEIGDCLIESDVNGRLIATYKLHNAIHFNNYIIDLVEVPAPKKAKATKEGFEHIEVITTQPFLDLQEKYKNLPLVVKGLDKDFNPELEVDFGGMAIKFHTMSLESVINIEKNKMIDSFLKETDILRKFKPYHPQISGTFPIGLEIENSDLDILFCNDNLETFSKEMISSFGEYKNFKIKKASHQGLESVIVNFDYDHLKVECFCQRKWTLWQNANMHMLIEGRLLKILPTQFKETIISLKESGLKTEQAFGKVLSLDNPYEELIELYKLSDLELKNKFYQQHGR